MMAIVDRSTTDRCPSMVKWSARSHTCRLPGAILDWLLHNARKRLIRLASVFLPLLAGSIGFGQQPAIKAVNHGASGISATSTTGVAPQMPVSIIGQNLGTTTAAPAGYPWPTDRDQRGNRRDPAAHGLTIGSFQCSGPDIGRRTNLEVRLGLSWTVEAASQRLGFERQPCAPASRPFGMAACDAPGFPKTIPAKL